MVIEQKFKPGEEPDPTEYLFISMEMRMKDQSKPYDAKTACWVPDDIEGFVLGEIRGAKGDTIQVWTGSEVLSLKCLCCKKCSGLDCILNFICVFYFHRRNPSRKIWSTK